MSATNLAIRRGRRLEYFTIGYNCLEGIVAIAAGLLAGSVSLVGFGFDSAIEVTSGAILLWRLRAGGEHAERAALRAVGVCFLALAAYVGYESAAQLLGGGEPEKSLPGIVLAAVSLLVMPLVSRAKRRVAATLASEAMHADAKQTEFCAWLSAILLAGLGLNAALGWWWADPAAGLVMTPIIAAEGVRALRGKKCCCDC